VQASQGETEVGLSVVTVAELVHGLTEPKQKRSESVAWNLLSGCVAMCRCIQ